MEFTLVFPAKTKDSWLAFKGLFPKDVDPESTSSLLLGVIDEAGQVLGGMAVDIEPVAYTINWLYVAPEARRQGAATALLDGFIDFMDQTNNLRELEMEFYEDQTELGAFLESRQDCYIEEDCKCYVLGTKDIFENKLVKKLLKYDFHAKAWNEVSETMRGGFLEKLEQEGYYKILERKAWEASIDKDLSFFTVEADMITGCIFIKKLTATDLEISFLYCMDERKVPDLLAAALNSLIVKYKDIKLHITAASDFSEKVMTKDFGIDTPSQIRYLASFE